MKVYTILLLVFFVACKETSKKPEPIQKIEVETAKSDTFKMLQGTWMNVQDTLSTISFNGNTSTNAYKGVENGREIYFTLGATCATNQNATTREEDRFINTTGAAEECYYIETLDETNLTMKLVAQNIVLQFKRQ